MAGQQRLTAGVEEWRRLRAWELHQAGWTGRAIAAALGVGPSAVSNWLRKARNGGVAALRSQRQRTGKRPKLTEEQHQRLLELLRAGATAQGDIGDRWTGKRVAALIKREFGVTYHPEYVPRLLRSLGWTPQQPVTLARQRDDQKIEQFKAEWEDVKRGRTRKDAPLSG